MKSSQLATYPSPYPDSWYVLARSKEVSKTRALGVEALGTKFILFRDREGKVGVLDNACPHMGASLCDGKMRDGTVECPFHRWRFRRDGNVDHIPYSDSPRGQMRTRAWPVIEQYGFIWIYFSEVLPERGESLTAPYRLPVYSEVDNGQIVYRGSYDSKIVKMHLIEFIENSADMQHFNTVHGQMVIPWTQIPVPGVTIHHTATWEKDASQGHVAWFNDEAVLHIFGRVIEKTRAHTRTQFIGPGAVVSFVFDIPSMGKILLLQNYTPVGPLAQKVRFTWFAGRKMPRILVSYVIGSWISQWKRDFAIWEKKVYLDRPMILASDGPIHQLRKWYQQFFPSS